MSSCESASTARYESPSTARLVLVEQSGVKHEIPQPSTAHAMVEAQQAMHCRDSHLREVKVVRQKAAVARWRTSDEGWRRVA